jgi:hypothetical protein
MYQYPTNSDSEAIENAINALAEQWLGRNGVCGIREEWRDDHLAIVVTVSEAETTPALPAVYKGFPVLVETGGPYEAH